MTKLRTHYDNLKVARDAPDAVIRAAYKVLAQKYHPDKNPGDERAARVMQIINQSYGVLSDPEQRKEHDEWIRAQELLQAAEALLKARSEPAQQAPPIPPQWQETKRPTPHTRASRNWLSILLLLPFRLIGAVIEFSPRLAGMGLLLGGLWLWSAMTPDRPPPSGPKPYHAEAPPEVVSTGGMKDCGAVGGYRKKGDKEFDGTVYRYTQNDGSVIYTTRKPAGCEGVGNAAVSAKDAKPSQYLRPDSAPNGKPWPARAAYVKGYPIDNDTGYSEVTVDNAQNDSDVFVKLVSLDEATAFPVRQFYIPAGSSFTMNKVTAGQYDLRYRDLNTGGLSRSESFEIKETHTDDGVQYSSLTMTLYKVQDGNFQTYDLADGEF